MDELVLAEQGSFLTANARGDIPVDDPGALGFFCRDMRFLSGFTLRLNDEEIPLLGVDAHGYWQTLTYSTPEVALNKGKTLPSNIVLRRTRYLAAAERQDGLPALRERIAVTSYNRVPIDMTVDLTVTADFRDIFDVRGFLHGAPAPADAPAFPRRDTIVLMHHGRDRVRRSTVCTLDPAPALLGPLETNEGARAHYNLVVAPGTTSTIDLYIEPFIGEGNEGAEAAPTISFDLGLSEAVASHRRWIEEECTAIETDNPALNATIARSVQDLRLLLQDQSTGPYIVAGVPWYAVPFGRDGIITALQTLMLDPDLAVGTLRFLAAHQGRALDPSRDEEPGKIMHEMRAGELVGAGLAPFGPYYGTVDATPLYLVLLGRTLQWIDDDDLVRALEPTVRAALSWLDAYGDPDGDGLIEFERKAGRGITNQGWKDSADSLQFPDGSYADAPIALVEVQGYAYEARLAAAAVLRRLGDEGGASLQDRKAAALRERFNAAFWLDAESFYAQALDGSKRPAPAVTSNVGHALWSGIVDEERSAPVAARLLSADMCTGWGVRTLSSLYPSYNPLSYHNGSIWPHDVSIVAAGLKRYGHDDAAATLLAQTVDAAQGFVDARLPELYGGLPRGVAERGPAPYPVSCSPQAWAAGSVILLLQSVLGLEPDAARGVVRLRPILPPGVRRVAVRRLRVGAVLLDLRIEQTEDGGYAVESTIQGGGGRRTIVRRGEEAVIALPNAVVTAGTARS